VEFPGQGLKSEESEPCHGQGGVDVEGTVVAGHADRCVVEPSELGACHGYFIDKGRRGLDVAVDERSGECQEANKAWHQR